MASSFSSYTKLQLECSYSNIAIKKTGAVAAVTVNVAPAAAPLKVFSLHITYVLNHV